MRVRSLAALLAAFVGCTSGPSPGDRPPGLTDAARAEAWLAVAEPLPPRPDVVALADAVAIAASRSPAADEQARLYRLAAALRVRLHRLDGADADAREALELLASATRAVPGTEAACEADRARAHLAGELAHSAVATYRELYLAERRHGPLATRGESACLAAVRTDLELAAGFRPSGAELAALEREGDVAARPPATAPAPPASSASAPPPASADPAAPPPDVIIRPEGLATAKGPVKITGIDKYPGEAGGRVVIRLEAPTTFTVGQLPADDRAKKDARIFVDIDQATSKGLTKEIEVGGAIKRVRTGPREGGSRVVLDLASEMHRRVFYLPEPFRIVVDVSSRAPAVASAPSGPRPVRRVVIDPGHGGQDAGAVGPTGLQEKEVVLDVAHRIAPLLAHELGVETLLTRDRDVFVPLDERSARANAFHADLFISVHCNASENGDARGIEVFVLDELKDTSRASARVAAVENGLGKTTTLDPAALDAQMAHILTGLRTGDTAARSRKLGDLMARASLASLGQKYPDTRDHGLKSAGFYVLAGAEMPAVLFETSFISNPEDESRLAQADYRQKLADAVVNAVRAYRDGK